MSRRGENITKRKDGRWEARVLLGHDLQGKPQYRYLYAKSYNEAKQKKQLCLMQSPKVSNDPVIILDSLFEEYLKSIHSQVKESTLARYKDIIRLYLSPSFGELASNKLTTPLINDFIKQMCYDGQKDRKLSSKRIRDIVSVLKASFKYGIKQGYIIPAVVIELPKKEPQAIDMLNEYEQETLIKYVLRNNTAQNLGIIISLFTGIRIGELCALRWSDINLQAQTLSIKNTLYRIPSVNDNSKKTKLVMSSPKTSSSTRIIPLPKALIPFLTSHHSHEKYYVLTGKDTPIEPSNYYVKYQAVLKKCGMDKHSFHALRHTFATKCIEHGFDPKSLSEILGHSDIRITLERYVHPSMELKRKNMNRLSEVLSSQISSQ